jgi:hypothetical protein
MASVQVAGWRQLPSRLSGGRLQGSGWLAEHWVRQLGGRHLEGRQLVGVNWGRHFAEISKEIVPIGPQMGVCGANRSLRYVGFSLVQDAVVRSGGPWT